MKRIVTVVGIFMSFIAASHAMEEGTGNSLTASTDWEIVGQKNQPLPEIFEQIPPTIIVSHGLTTDTAPQNEGENGPQKEEKADHQQLIQEPQIADIHSELSVPKSHYRIPPLKDLYQSILATITGNPWYQNRTARYSLLAGTGTITITIGALGYFYLYKK